MFEYSYMCGNKICFSVAITTSGALGVCSAISGWGGFFKVFHRKSKYLKK